MNKILNIILVFILTTSGLVAQENLTLFKAVKNTLENNLDIKISENLQEIAKNNSSILNNNYLPNIQLGSDINTNVQNIEIETPSGIAGALDNTQTEVLPKFEIALISPVLVSITTTLPCSAS